MRLYKNIKAMVQFPDGNTDFFYIVNGVLQGDILALYLIIMCLNDVLQTSINLMKENGFTLKKARNRQYPAETMTDTDYADDLVFLTNTSA